MANRPLPTLERELLSERIHGILKTMITDSTLGQGEQVVESQFAKQFGVSQAPVREALRRLAHDGLITQVRNRGSFVTEFSKAEAEDARFARVGLEALAARLLHGRLTPALRTRLLDLIAEMSTAADAREISAFREHDFAFHRAVIEASGNTMLPRMWDALEPSLRSKHVLADPNYVGDWRTAANSHLELVEVLGGDDPNLAADRFTAHVLGMSTQAAGPMGSIFNSLVEQHTAEFHARH